jgi:HEAT repeat protein
MGMASLDEIMEKTPEEEEKERYKQMDEFNQLISEVNNPRDFLGDPESGMDAVRKIDEVIEKLVEIGDARAVEPLIILAKKHKSFSSESAIEALGNFNNKRSIDYLVKSLEDKDRDIRTAAAEALDKLGWEPE